MNVVLAIVCFTLVASAAAKPVNNYKQTTLQVKQPFSSGTPISNSAMNIVQQQLYANPLHLFNPPASKIVGPSLVNVIPAQQPAIYSAPVTSSSQFNYQPQQQTIISKDIYIHSAPEETEEIGTDQNVEAGPIRKNYRIVFINAPKQNLKLNLESIKRAQAHNEEKTVIYVLSKKPDLSNIQSQLSAVQTEPKAHKPEVYFIKYKTQEEANRAQMEIQAQYDALGGSTKISDEGFAPITSVVSGGPVNVDSIAANFGSVAPNTADFSSGPSNSSPFGSSSNFVQSSSENQQQFVQNSFNGGQGSKLAYSA